ncbi:hypothetical protein B0H17DRAFT_1138363 [Mycena rosella]|uniref:Uncharacterized protein n=1 Tax=Mycena rosella TaxID=1033263 RepID=A0AAD7G9S9_MYCRO|nr:hypothetical protein B0H17DRAFT_1138363 [Mycena rosella]
MGSAEEEEGGEHADVEAEMGEVDGGEEAAEEGGDGATARMRSRAGRGEEEEEGGGRAGGCGGGAGLGEERRQGGEEGVCTHSATKIKKFFCKEFVQPKLFGNIHAVFFSQPTVRFRAEPRGERDMCSQTIERKNIAHDCSIRSPCPLQTIHASSWIKTGAVASGDHVKPLDVGQKTGGSRWRIRSLRNRTHNHSQVPDSMAWWKIKMCKVGRYLRYGP